MLSNKRFTNIISILLILSILLISLFPMNPVHADSISSRTTFYFVDMLDESLPRDSNSDMFPLVSTLPPTKSNDSYYPPNLMEGKEINDDQLTIWFMYWALDLFGDMEDFENYSDFFDGIKILLPNPLAITEIYEYAGNETININGDVIYNFYTSSKFASKIDKNDQVKVSLYTYSNELPLPIEIANSSTINISSAFLQNVIPRTITLKVDNFKLRKDTNLIFSVELIPGNKSMTEALLNNDSGLRKVVDKVFEWVSAFVDRSDNSTLKDIMDIIDLFQNLSSELNISSQQFAEVLNSLFSSTFVYASQTHPASVTVPFIAGDFSRENFLTYYFHTDSLMDANSPTSSEYSSLSLVDETGIWKGPVLPRSKILSNASAFVYIENKDFRIIKDPITVEAKLLSNGKELATTSQVLSKTTLLAPSSLNAYRFTYENLSESTELFYGTNLELQLSILGPSNATSLLGPSVTIYYNSAQYPSFLSFKLSETDHLSVTGVSDPEDGKILPGGSVIYTMDISCELADTITPSLRTDTFTAEQQKQWKIDFSSSSLSIGNNESKTITVTVTSLNKTVGAYDAGPLSVILDFIGSTGFASIPLFARVSTDAVTYDFIILAPDDKEIARGTNTTYQFKVTNNNTGIYPDGYIFTVTKGTFNVTVFPLTVNDVSYQQTVTVNVTVEIPSKTDVKKDTFIFKVISKGNGLDKMVTINSTIVGASFFENLYDSFVALADQLGLTGIFGSYAPHFLIVILFIILFFIIILMVFIFTTKFVNIICSDRIKEIYPNEQASFELTIRNPTKKTRSYALDVELSENGAKWQSSLDKTTLLVPPKECRIVTLTVASSDAIDENDWTKITVYATPEDRKNSQSIDLITSIKDGAVDLSIDNVFHWPGIFESDQKVQTSFKLRNNAHIQAKKVHVHLYINGKEKNKVEDVVIPAGGYADITLPWIADKGKNDIQIIVS